MKTGGHRLFAAVLYRLASAVNCWAEFRIGLTAIPGFMTRCTRVIRCFTPKTRLVLASGRRTIRTLRLFFRLWRPGRAGGRAVAGEYFSRILPAVCAFTGFNMHLAAGFRDLEPLVAVSRF